MAFHTIWSVDIGKSSLKAAKLRRDRNNIEILAVDKVDYPMSKNGVDATTQAKEAIGIFRARNDVREPIAVAHPGQGTFYRSIKVPASDAKKLDSMVGFEASQQIPFPLDEVIWDYHIIDREYLPGEEREVALFAVRREAMDDFLVDFNNEQLAVEVVSIGYLGLLNFIIHDIHPEEPSIVLDIGAAHTDLVLVDGSRFWIRPLPHSGADLTRSIMSRFRMGYAEAEKLKVDASRAPKQAVKIFQAVIQPKLKELVGEIHRSIGYYRSQAGEVTFKRLYLLGNGSKIVGIKKFLEEQLGVQVQRVQSISHFRVNREVNLRLLQNHLPSFATSLGCGLQALGAASCEVDLVPREEKLRKELGRKKRHAFIAAAILLAIMLVAHFMLASKIEQTDETYNEATELVGVLDKQAQSLRKVRSEEGGVEHIRGLKGQLRQFGEMRGLLLDGMIAMERVLATFPNNNPIEVVEGESTDEESSKAKQEYLTKGILENLWVPWLEITQTTFPEPEAGQKEVKGPTAPAYRFRVFAVISMRGDNETSAQFIRDRFAEPLAKEIKSDLLSVQTTVEVKPGTSVPEIYFDPERGPGRTPKRIAGAEREEKEEEVEEGPDLFGAEVTWLLVPRHPPEEKAKPEETKKPVRKRRPKKSRKR